MTDDPDFRGGHQGKENIRDSEYKGCETLAKFGCLIVIVFAAIVCLVAAGFVK